MINLIISILKACNSSINFYYMWQLETAVVILSKKRNESTCPFMSHLGAEADSVKLHGTVRNLIQLRSESNPSYILTFFHSPLLLWFAPISSVAFFSSHVHIIPLHFCSTCVNPSREITNPMKMTHSESRKCQCNHNDAAILALLQHLTLERKGFI